MSDAKTSTRKRRKRETISEGVTQLEQIRNYLGRIRWATATLALFDVDILCSAKNYRVAGCYKIFVVVNFKSYGLDSVGNLRNYFLILCMI